MYSDQQTLDYRLLNRMFKRTKGHGPIIITCLECEWMAIKTLLYGKCCNNHVLWQCHIVPEWCVPSPNHPMGYMLISKRVLCSQFTHWGRVTHICVGKLTIIGSDNGLSPGRRQAIIWTNAGILSIGPLGTNFSEILIAIQTFSFRKMHLKMSSAKWRLFCLGLNDLTG